MKSIYYTASTLNGFIATPDHSLDWLLQFHGPEGSFDSFIATIGVIAMGANTFQWLLDNHVQPKNAPPQPWPYTQPAWIFTHRDPLSFPKIDAPLHFAHGDPRTIYPHMQAAAQGKNLWVAGGGELVGQFLDHGLLDELIIQIAPVLLTAGTPLLPRTVAKPPLRLLSAKPLNEDLVELHYAVKKP